MQLGRTAWEQMSPSSMRSCAPGAEPTWWQVRQSQASLGPGNEGRQSMVGKQSLQEHLAVLLCMGLSLP